jgi:hypothetical protein
MDASRPVTIYISAAADLMAEREALARMVAALPVTLAWHIAQTPVTDADSLDLEALKIADLHFLVMASDIRAPVGLEWRIVSRAGQPSAAFLKRGVMRTPAGEVFIKDAGVTWQPFAEPADLARQVQRLLVEHLLRHALRYALTPEELARLALTPSPSPNSGRGEKDESLVEESGRGKEAGHSAVILSRERFEPSGGVVVGKSGGKPTEAR